MSGDAISASLAILWVLLPPFVAAAIAAAMPSRWRTPPWIVAIAAAITSLIALLYSSRALPCTPCVKTRISGLEVHLYIDKAGFTLALITLINGLLILLYSLGYISPGNAEHPVYDGYPRYYALFSLFIGAMLGVAFSQDLLTFTLFYELTSICSCLLIGFYREREHAYNGYVALVLTHVGGVCLLVAAALLYKWAHSITFSALKSLEQDRLVIVAMLFLIAGLAKSAQLPFHHWLPRAMVAPTTVSAYLHAASMVNIGVFTLMRLAEYAGVEAYTGTLLLVLSLATMFYGAAMYYAQRDLKRLLAYSTIVQLGYMMLGVSFTLLNGEPGGLEASLYHMWNHSFAKALLFLSVGALAYSLGVRELKALTGLAGRLPLVAFTWALGAAAICGIPPFNCFYSKLAVLAAGLNASLLARIAACLAIVEFILTFIAFTSTIPSLLEKGAGSQLHSKPTLSMKAVLVSLSLLVLISPYMYTSLLEAGGGGA